MCVGLERLDDGGAIPYNIPENCVLFSSSCSDDCQKWLCSVAHIDHCYLLLYCFALEAEYVWLCLGQPSKSPLHHSPLHVLQLWILCSDLFYSKLYIGLQELIVLVWLPISRFNQGLVRHFLRSSAVNCSVYASRLLFADWFLFANLLSIVTITLASKTFDSANNLLWVNYKRRISHNNCLAQAVSPSWSGNGGRGLSLCQGFPFVGLYLCSKKQKLNCYFRIDYKHIELVSNIWSKRSLHYETQYACDSLQAYTSFENQQTRQVLAQVQQETCILY